MTAKPAKSTVAVVPGNLQGLSIDASDSEALRHAIDWAFDYRGDVTIVQTDGRVIEGYLFDRQWARDPHVRVIPKSSEERVRVAIADIASISFSGKDTASGKSFENWIKKYAQKKLAGESASIESESLDE